MSADSGVLVSTTVLVTSMYMPTSESHRRERHGNYRRELRHSGGPYQGHAGSWWGGGIVVDRLGGNGTYDLSDYELVLLSGVADTANIQGLVVRQDASREVNFYIGTSANNRYFRLQGTWDHMSITTSLSSPAFFGIK